MNIKRPTPTQAMTRFTKDSSDKKLRSLRKAADSRKAVDSEKLNQTGSKSDKPRSFLERRAERLKLAKARDGATQLELRKKAVNEKAVDKEAKKVADARRRAYFAAKNKKAKDAADEEAKKITDGSFEVTEENFRLLVKEALLEALREMGASVEVDEKKEENLIEPVEADAPAEEDGDEILEEDETLEDADVQLTEILEDPKKKDALRNLIADELKSSFKAIDNAPALFTHRYEQAAPAAKQESPKIKNRYE